MVSQEEPVNHSLRTADPHETRNAVPTLMEWDNDVPPIPIFTGAVAHAEARCRRRRGDIDTALLLDR